MTDRDETHDHAMREAQRRRSNVYAFRKVKWGAPTLSSTRLREVRGSPKTGRNPLGLVTIGIVAILSVLALAAWLS